MLAIVLILFRRGETPCASIFCCRIWFLFFSHRDRRYCWKFFTSRFALRSRDRERDRCLACDGEEEKDGAGRSWCRIDFRRQSSNFISNSGNSSVSIVLRSHRAVSSSDGFGFSGSTARASSPKPSLKISSTISGFCFKCFAKLSEYLRVR